MPILKTCARKILRTISFCKFFPFLNVGNKKLEYIYTHFVKFRFISRFHSLPLKRELLIFWTVDPEIKFREKGKKTSSANFKFRKISFICTSFNFFFHDKYLHYLFYLFNFLTDWKIHWKVFPFFFCWKKIIFCKY